MPSVRSSSRMSRPVLRCRKRAICPARFASAMPLAYAGKQIQKTSVNVSERKGVSRIDAVASVVVIDVANVMGARPDGWWRDRAGAAQRLAGQLVAALSTAPADLSRGLGYPEASAAR